MATGPYLRVIRAESTPSGSVGILLVDGIIQCWTLQPDPTDKHFHIPAGEYRYKRFHGLKHPDTFEILVPGHSALLFHSGNTEEDTEGCIILGNRIDWYEGNRVIKNGTSRPAFSDFMYRMRDVKEGRIKVEDV